MPTDSHPRYRFQTGKGPERRLRSPLTRLAEAGSIKKSDLNKLKKKGKPLDFGVPDKRGNLPLQVAASCGATASMKVLIEAGADPNRRDPAGFSPLDAAAVSGEARAVRSLLLRGAEVDAVDARGYTALHRVAELGERADAGVLRALLAAGANPAGRAPAGQPAPLELLRVDGRRDAVAELTAAVEAASVQRPDGLQGNERFDALMATLAKGPSRKAFSAAWKVLADWPDGPDRDLAGDHVRATLTEWPESLRHVVDLDVAVLERHALVPLVRSARVKVAGMDSLSDDLVAALKPLGLTELTLQGSDSLRTIAGLEQLSTLQSLSLPGCRRLAGGLDGLSALPDLRRLELSFCIGLEDLTPIGSIASLEELDLSECRSVESLDGLGSLRQLKTLVLGNCNGLTDVSALAGLTELHTLDLTWCDVLRDVSPLAELTALETVTARHADWFHVLPERDIMKTRKQVAAWQEQIRAHYAAKS